MLKLLKSFFYHRVYRRFKSRSKLLEKQYIVISYPKSGRTWLRVILDHLGIYLPYDHAGAQYNGKVIDSKNIKIDKYYKNKIIFIIRDPRDTIVSSYFQATKRQKKFQGTLSEFIRDDIYGIQSILEFHEIWLSNREKFKDFIVIRYEDMKKDTENVIEKLIRFLELKNVSRDEIKAAVEFARFDKMKLMEKKGKFESYYGNRIKPRDLNDPESFKVRKGKVGGYFDYLSSEEIDYCEQLMKSFGSGYAAKD